MQNEMSNTLGRQEFNDAFDIKADKRALLGPSNSHVAIMERKDGHDSCGPISVENSMAISMRLERDMFGKTLVCGALRYICNNRGLPHKCDEILCSTE